MRTGMMTSWMIVLMVCAAASGAEPDVEPPAEPTAEALLQAVLVELKAANQKLEKLNKQSEAFGPYGADDEEMAAVREALTKLRLPQAPAREQVDAYIAEIARISAKAEWYWHDDPRIGMLVSLGPDHMEAMINGWIRFDDLRWVLGEVIVRTCREEDKAVVINRLLAHPDLVEVVIRRGWERDAREPLLRALAARPDDLTDAWLQAVINLAEPASHDALKHYMVRGPERGSKYRLIRNIPGIDLKAAVGEAWQRARTDDDAWEQLDMAAIAVDYGHEDALGLLVDQVDSNLVQDMIDGGVNPARTAILLHIDYYGTNKEIKQWYQDNREHLRFDEEKKRFYVAGGMS